MPEVTSIDVKDAAGATQSVGLGAKQTVGADAVSNTLDRKATSSFISAFNGTTWDRVRSGLVAVQTTFTGILNAIGMARYNATPPTLSDGNIAPLQATSDGSLKTSITTALPAGTNAIGKLAANSGVDIGDVDVTSVAAPSTIRNEQVTAGNGSAQQCSNLSVAQGVTLKADDDNSGSIYVGGSGVSNTTGYRLKAGQSVFVACNNANLLYAYGSAASQKLHLIGS